MMCLSVGGKKRRRVCLNVYFGKQVAVTKTMAQHQVYMWVGYWHLCVCIYVCMPVQKCVSVCVGSDQTLAFQSCDGCHSNARGKKCLERRQTQT